MSFFPRTSAELNAMEKPAAMVRPAKNCAYYMDLLQAAEDQKGRILGEFKESGTWKERFGTWEEVCEDYLGMSKRTVDRHIAKSKTLQSKVSNLGQVVPSENNLSKGSTTKTEQSPTLSQDAKPTPKPQPQGPDSEEAPPPKPKVEPVKDKTGVVVPARCLPLTERRQEVTEMEYHASKLAALFEKLQTNNDVLYSQLRASGNIQTYMNHASTMRYTISHCIPDVVCPACKGDGKARTVVKERDWCYECAGSGMISEVKWNREWVKSGDRLKLAEVERRRNGSA